jgi:hypothetical protein
MSPATGARARAARDPLAIDDGKDEAQKPRSRAKRHRPIILD